ncbi:VOC family protein [Nocardioides panacis]|uniref:VOC family protein n=1 Tax=Nocardioides panacis TaxID=2849501 RepID=A0A975Y0H0_9ACTN|nr:VOC family protein [Nocardioides panacis]QWZ08466.1 VOC family protein [Nocardioides panacis]
MPEARTFPHGVPSWVDVDLPDVDAGTAFYAALFGWTFADATPPDAPFRYVIAQLDGRDVAAVAGPSSGPARWSTYVAVDDADDTAARLVAAGGTLVSGPLDAGPGGRTATVLDPEGAELRLWQARRRLGVQVVNQPGAWNFSNLRTADLPAACDFYGPVLGWAYGASGFATSVSVPGYGDHLEATVDPGIRTRQAHAPEGFADVVAAFEPLADGERPHWQVVFAVADRDASAATVETLGGVVVSTAEDRWVRRAVVRDPQGAELVLSQFAPQDW